MALNNEVDLANNTKLVNGEENKSDANELVLIQDNVFSVKIHVPGLEPFDLQVCM